LPKPNLTTIKKEIKRYPKRKIDMTKYKYVRLDKRTWVLKKLQTENN